MTPKGIIQVERLSPSRIYRTALAMPGGQSLRGSVLNF
jgi:hypothetical protein